MDRIIECMIFTKAHDLSDCFASIINAVMKRETVYAFVCNMKYIFKKCMKTFYYITFSGDMI